MWSGSTSSGSSNGVLDFIDLNGDGYPDIVGQTQVQFTLPTGGLGSTANIMGGTLRTSNSTEDNVGVGGNPAQFVSDALGNNSKSNGSGSQMSPLGFSGGVGSGSSVETNELIDMNGDGLPDKVSLNTQTGALSVQVNTGYGFLSAQTWPVGGAAINNSNSNSANGGIGFNDGVFGFAGGASASGNTSHSKVMLMDINGDGLPDLVQSIGGGNYQVCFNTGSGFSAPVTWSGGSGSGDLSRSQSNSVGGGAYFTIQIPLFLFGSIIINPGGDASVAMNTPQVTFSSITGDGYPDQLESNGDGSLTVYKNQTGRTNLLKDVKRPMGATFSLNYQRDGNNFANPHNHWNLANVVVFDGGQNGNMAQGGADYQATSFAYGVGTDSGGNAINAYDRFERDFLGYAVVTETQFTTTGWAGPSASPASSLSPYRQVIRQYLNYNFYEKGLLTDEMTNDVSGSPKPFLETINQYQLVDVNNPTGAPIPLTTLSVNALESSVLFPQAVTTFSKSYEGGTGVMSTYQTFAYDAYGNVTNFYDNGDLTNSSDPNSPVSATIAYTSANAAFTSPNYLPGLPTTILVTNAGGSQLLRHREATYDPGTGNLTEVRQYLADGTAAVNDIAYDAYGNDVTETGPSNLNGTRYQLSYQYDPTLETYPVNVTDSTGYTSTMSYDLRFGKPVTEIDENGQKITTSYDVFGRTVTMIGPFELPGPAQQRASNYTIAFDYHPDALNGSGNPMPYAHTAHFDGFRCAGSDPIETILYTDGLKRVIQTKKDDTTFQGTLTAAIPVMSVSGRVVFDQVGRTIGQYYPVTEPKGNALTGNAVFNAAYDTIQPTTMSCRRAGP